MRLELLRYSDNGESTTGLLKVNGKFFCYTLEDEYRDVKVMHETRIPEGTYKIELRNEGGLTQKYAKRYPGIHKGMLWLRNVPNFKYVYIHAGNTDDHTSGCLLVGDNANNNTITDGFIGSSRPAYTRLYKEIISAMDRGEDIEITIKNI